MSLLIVGTQEDFCLHGHALHAWRGQDLRFICYEHKSTLVGDQMLQALVGSYVEPQIPQYDAVYILSPNPPVCEVLVREIAQNHRYLPLFILTNADIIWEGPVEVLTEVPWKVYSSESDGMCTLTDLRALFEIRREVRM